MKPAAQWPHLVEVKSLVTGFPPLRFNLTDAAHAERHLETTLALIHDAGEKWTVNAGILLRVMHAWHAVDALLDAWLELTRLQHDTEVEQSWWGDLPAWPAEPDQPSEVAA